MIAMIILIFISLLQFSLRVSSFSVDSGSLYTFIRILFLEHFEFGAMIQLRDKIQDAKASKTKRTFM